MPVTFAFIMTVIFIGRAARTELRSGPHDTAGRHVVGMVTAPSLKESSISMFVAAQLLMTFLDVSVPQRSLYGSSTSELFVEMVLSHPEQEFCLSLVAREVMNYATLCYLYIMVSLWLPDLRISLCFGIISWAYSLCQM